MVMLRCRALTDADDDRLFRDDDENVDGVRRLDMNLREWKATSIDRAGTNKKAMDIIHQDKGVKPFLAYCVSHGAAGCDKKGNMSVGTEVVKCSTGMVKYRL